MAWLRAVRTPPTAALDVLHHVWDAGDAAVLLDPEAPDAATAAALDVLRPATLVDVATDGLRDERTLADAEPLADDVALVVATSGSTGSPKGVELTHAALGAATRASLARLGAASGERWALALPTHHIAGLAVHLRAAALGTRVIPAFSTAALSHADAEHVALVPAQLAALLDADADLARFSSVLVGGAATSRQLHRRATAAGAPLVMSYGMSETCGGCVYDGVPLDDVEVAVDPHGVIRLRGPVRFSRYRRDPTATRAVLADDGWFTTGDLGHLVDGRLVVDGRADDVAVTGGENVPLAAVTRAVSSHPAVRDAVVTTRPHPRWGDELVAVVAGDGVDLAALKAHVRARHPAWWAPRAVLVLDALPRDAMGKLPADVLSRLAAAAEPTAGDARG